MAAIEASLERRDAQRQFLTDAMALLSSSLDYDTTVTSLAHLAVPQIADWCSIAMRNDDGSVSTRVVAHVDPAKVELARALERHHPYDPQAAHGIAAVLRTGQSEVIREIHEDLLVESMPDQERRAIMRDLGVRSSMVVPLKARGRILGAITLVSAESDHLFDDDDLALAEDLASRAALAIDNARLYLQARNLAAEQAAVMDRITDALLFVNTSERITFMNATARRFFAAPLRGKTVGTSVTQIPIFTWDGVAFHPDEVPSRRALRGETVNDLDWTVRLPGGRVVFCQGSASPVDADDGTRIGAVIAFRDVTERKQADEAQARLAAIVESSHDAIVGKTLEGIITSWNTGAQHVYGYEPAEVLGRSVDLLVPPGRPNEIPGILERVAQGERVEQLETVRQRQDGQIIDVSLTVSPVWDRAGRITGASAIARDITEQRRSQHVVERQAALLDLSHDAIFVRAFETDIIQFWNRGAQELYGFAAGEAIGAVSHDLLHTVHAIPLDEAKEILVRTGHWEGELIHTKHDDTRTVVMSRWAVQWEDGRPSAILETNTDIAKRKQVEEELRRLSAELEQRVVERTIELESVNKELESFAYSVSHDLRAPLRSMDGFSQVLVERYADQLDERGTRYLTHIRDAAQEMGQLIDALLQLSRVTRGEMQRTHVDLSALARAAAAQLRKTEPGRAVTFAIVDGLVATGDAPLLRVLLENLLGNAWKFTRKRPDASIAVEMTQADGIPVYAVRDNGAGFDMTYAAKLFLPFQRLHTAGEFEGTGIGLATVQGIVRRHGGRAWAEGVVGKGATIFFTLQPDSKDSP